MATQSVQANNRQPSWSTLSSNPCSCVGAFLSGAEFARAAAVSRGFQATLQTSSREWFLLDAGALTPSDQTDPASLRREFSNMRKLRTLPAKLENGHIAAYEKGVLKIHNLNHAGFFSTIAYYCGYSNPHAQLAEDFGAESAKKAAQIDELLAMNPPTTLVGFRNICVRAKNLEREIFYMDQALKAGEAGLDRDTDQLCFLVRWICKFVQWVFGFFISRPAEVQKIADLDTRLNGDKGALARLFRGKFAATPNAGCGVRIGETAITRDRVVGVYAMPRYHTFDGEARYTGDVVFVLSEKGVSGDFLADLTIQRLWQNADPEGWSTVIEDSDFNARAVFYRRLEVRDFSNRGSDETYFSVNNDRPFMRKMAQLSAEILWREGETHLEHCNAYSYAHVLTAGGFESEKSAKIWKKIHAAREKGKIFPDYKDEMMFNMKLSNKPAGSVLNTVVDFGSGATTWGEIIRTEPMLFGTGPLLPRYWKQNLYELEVAAPAPAIDDSEE